MPFYPTDRAEARQTINRKIKAIRLDVTMLKKVSTTLAAYKRKQINKYLKDEMKKMSINFWETSYKFASTRDFEFSDFDRVLETSAPDGNGTSTCVYRENCTIHINRGLPEIPALAEAVMLRLEGLRGCEAEYLALLDKLDATLDRIDACSKELRELKEIDGMYLIKDLLPRA